jgi:hypothetical protein
MKKAVYAKNIPIKLWLDELEFINIAPSYVNNFLLHSQLDEMITSKKDIIKFEHFFR